MSKLQTVTMGLLIHVPDHMRRFHEFARRCAAGTDSFAAMLERGRLASNRNTKTWMLRLEREAREIAAKAGVGEGR